MKLENKSVGLAITGSFCNFSEVKGVIDSLKEQNVSKIIPIISTSAKDFDTRFYKAKEFYKMLEENTKNKVIDSIVKAEVVGPNKPVVIGVSTNDGLGKSLKNIAELIDTKNMYFIPFRQDDYISKPKSLVLDYTYVIDTIENAFDGIQIQPVLARIK